MITQIFSNARIAGAETEQKTDTNINIELMYKMILIKKSY